jgi:hypothetical protein
MVGGFASGDGLGSAFGGLYINYLTQVYCRQILD